MLSVESIYELACKWSSRVDGADSLLFVVDEVCVESREQTHFCAGMGQGGQGAHTRQPIDQSVGHGEHADEAKHP
jgi:hypothetical protein